MSRRHWTPRYLVNRARVWLHERRHKQTPWFTSESVLLLDRLLRRSDVGIEWGSGRSTVWFARRVHRLISIEHVPEWRQKVEQMLAVVNLTNVDLRLAEYDAHSESTSPYVCVLEELPTESVDFAVVDGMARDQITMGLLDKIRPGGLLILDNANLYLDHPTCAPHSRAGKGHANDIWTQIARRLCAWRAIWTTNGVADTALWIKTSPS